MLTLITVSHCNPKGLQSLYRILADGLDSGLRWLVQDSAACEVTRRWASTIDHRGFEFHAESDSGIYDAMNKALRRIKTPYYVVVGSDDGIHLDAIAAIYGILSERLKASSDAPDIMTYPVAIGRRIRRRQPLWPAQVNVLGLTASHSVGTIIRTDLHARIGWYDTRFRILADSLLLRRAQLAGCRFEHHRGPVLGWFSTSGVSSRDLGRVMLENYSYNVECGSSRLLQSLMFLVRLCAYRPRSFL